MKKRLLLILGLSIFVVAALVIPQAGSRTKNYYSGKAVTYEGQLIFGTVNTGAFELFTLENGNIERTANFKPRFVSLPKGSDSYADLEFEAGSDYLYAYLTDGRYLYKYDISNIYNPKLLEKERDNSWDWFNALEMTDDYLVTIGNKGIKYWNRDLDIVNSFPLKYGKHENVSISSDSELIFNIQDNVLEVYDTAKREKTASIWLEVRENGIRGIYHDFRNNEIFVTDDEGLKVFSEQGSLLREFEHTSDYGYDVEPSNFEPSVYFSDGIGIVKSDRSSLSPLDWVYTTSYTPGSSWTMDIEVTRTNDGDMIVAFNNSEIAVFDSELDLVDTFHVSATDDSPIEVLSLSLDKRSAFPGDYVTVRGSGFSPNEEIRVSMGDSYSTAVSDSNGRFSRTIMVISAKSQMIDIRAAGVTSGLSYSTTFEIR